MQIFCPTHKISQQSTALMLLIIVVCQELGVSVSDIIDIRPRVSEFTSTTLSPFEFDAREFTADGNSAANVLASDESINIDYSFYLPRIDKIYLTKDGTYQLITGIPAETPLPPNNIEGALEVSTLTLLLSLQR